ncbi:MAG: hypothetical protein C0401_04490 [Anaerolinea sp.]|nr:hypothetical protein [Anaerolinea sp.]
MTLANQVNLSLLNEIVQSKFQVPQGYSTDQLTPGLMKNLGSSDSDLRENSLDVLGQWIEEPKYTDAQILDIAQQMAKNLSVGLGESCSDSVFIRAFSALILESIIIVDRLRIANNGSPLLSRSHIHIWLHLAIELLRDEKDERGYVEQKGWAHCLAHTGDLLAEFSLHPALERKDLELILHTIAQKLIAPVEQVMVHNEDERLAAVVIAVLQRELVPFRFFEEWLASFVSLPGGMNWMDTLTLPTWNISRLNSKMFLRSLYFFFVFGFKNDPPYPPVALQKQLQPLVLKTLKQIYPKSRYGDGI